MATAVRGLATTLNANGFYKLKRPEYAVDHLIIGGGIVGLAIARSLCQNFPGKTTLLVERHSHPGQEISSRNSEVIHSGLYYPEHSLKTKLCIKGRQLMYEYCASQHIPVRKTGKLVVGNNEQKNYLHNLHQKALKLGQSSSVTLPTELISGQAAKSMEPDLGPNISAALWVPETGIVDSHSVMTALENDIQNANGQLLYSTKVVRIDSQQSEGWAVQLTTGDSQDADALSARHIINAAGLSSTSVLNTILPPSKRIPMYFAKGSYASYHGPGVSRVSHLIYPCPHTGSDAHAFQSLGTHLTLDLEGKIRFGPDIEWLSAPSDDQGRNSEDFWNNHLLPDTGRMQEMFRAVTDYLPGVDLEGFQPDYAGIRPKLVPPQGGFQDFVFRQDFASPQTDVADRSSMISLLGIESPGLTSSLAIGDHVLKTFFERK